MCFECALHWFTVRTFVHCMHRDFVCHSVHCIYLTLVCRMYGTYFTALLPLGRPPPPSRHPDPGRACLPSAEGGSRKDSESALPPASGGLSPNTRIRPGGPRMPRSGPAARTTPACTLWLASGGAAGGVKTDHAGRRGRPWTGGALGTAPAPAGAGGSPEGARRTALVPKSPPQSSPLRSLNGSLRA